VLRKRLAAVLARWAERLDPSVRSGPFPGAPEHWLRVVRERAPHYLREG
jgi:hypothetical protein